MSAPEDQRGAPGAVGEPAEHSTVGPPRWVKAAALVAVALLVLFVILMIAGGHGPGRHMGSDQPRDSATTVDAPFTL